MATVRGIDPRQSQRRADYGVLLPSTDPDTPEARGYHVLPTSICTNPAWRCVRCGTSKAWSTSTRCSSRTRWSPTSNASARSATAGTSPTGRSRASGRWFRAPAPVASIASAGWRRHTLELARPRSGRGAGVRQALMRVLTEERIRDWTNQRVRAQGEGGPVARARRARSARCTRAALNQRVQLLTTDTARHGRMAWGPADDHDIRRPRGARHVAQPRQHHRGRHHRDQQERGGRAGARSAARTRPWRRVVAETPHGSVAA